MRDTVPNMLREAADVYEARNKLYGDNYVTFGELMMKMIPDGLTIETAEDWNRVALLVCVIGKVQRYANNFASGGHDDSLLDLSVYAMMMRELDLMAKTETPRGG